MAISTPDSRRVEAWMDRRLQFEPEGSGLEFRAQLRQAIRGLPRGPALEAIYISEAEDFFDVENVLFYNVGTAAFRGYDYLRFGRVRANPPPSPDQKPWSHYHSYRVADELPDIEREPVVAFSFDLDLSGLKPAEVWSSAVRGDYSVIGDFPGREYALSVEIPRPRRTHLASLMKPLLDGVICALHRSDPDLDEVAVERLALRLGSPPDVVRGMLLNPPAPVLGARTLLRVWGDSVKWDPADDLLTSGELRIHESPSRQVRVTLFAAS